MAAGKFRVEFWDTVAGKPITQLSIPSKDGILAAGVPDFARDIAFKIKPQKGPLRGAEAKSETDDGKGHDKDYGGSSQPSSTRR